MHRKKRGISQGSQIVMSLSGRDSSKARARSLSCERCSPANNDQGWANGIRWDTGCRQTQRVQTGTCCRGCSAAFQLQCRSVAGRVHELCTPAQGGGLTQQWCEEQSNKPAGSTRSHNEMKDSAQEVGLKILWSKRQAVWAFCNSRLAGVHTVPAAALIAIAVQLAFGPGCLLAVQWSMFSSQAQRHTETAAWSQGRSM